MVRAVDGAIIAVFNGFVGRHVWFDELVASLEMLNLLKAIPFCAFLWWVWFRERPAARRFVVRALLGVVVAIALGRGLQLLLPMRLRPMHDPRFHFTIPADIEPDDTLVGWSSFPSDHAIVICAFATAVLLWSRPLGVLAWLWALVIVIWPRVYLGLHYPTDMLAGMMIGAGVMVAALRLPMPPRLLDLPARVEERHPSGFYAFAFLATYLLGTNFDDLRALGSAFWDALH